MIAFKRSEQNYDVVIIAYLHLWLMALIIISGMVLSTREQVVYCERKDENST